MVMTVITDLGMSQAVNIFAGRYPELVPVIHALMLRIVVGMWLVVSIVIVLAFFLLGQEVLPNLPARYGLAVLLALPLTVYAGLWNNLMLGTGRIPLLNAVQLFVGPKQIILIFAYVVVLSGGVGGAIGVYLVSLVVQSAIMLGKA